MKRIRLLDKSSIDKIAAGEVILNPASAVKELVENSLDAGSSYIRIYIENGGKRLIRVTDNGSGIFKEDIPTAFLRNATNKFEALDNISTLGFRGEALASISSVAKVTLTTKTKDDIAATKAEFINSELIRSVLIGGNIGTSVEVRDLFYNLPARLKHLKSAVDETAYVIETVSSEAAANPNVDFELYCDEVLKLSTVGKKDIYSVLCSLYGRRKTDEMTFVSFEDDPLYVKGYIVSPAFIKQHEELKLTILNNRPVDVPAITKAIDFVTNELFGKHGAGYVLFIELPYKMIDVNIHPQKTAVGFQNETLIMMLIKQGLREEFSKKFVLKTTDMYFDPVNHNQETIANSVQVNDLKTLSINDGMQFAGEQPDISKSFEAFPTLSDLISPDKLHTEQADNNDFIDEFKKPTITEPENMLFISDDTLTLNVTDSLITELSKSRYIGTAFGLYAMFEVNNAVYAIDTHAADERVLYEKYLVAFNSNTVQIQQLLIPITLKLSAKQHYTALSNAEVLNMAGFETDDFGDNEIIVRSVPVYLSQNNDIAERITNMLYELNDFSDGSDINSRNEKLIKCACHNAFRGSSNISETELRALLSGLALTKMPFTCPHGRPIIGKLSLASFMKAFERI